ncbi:cation efflux protein, CzcI-like [Acinetobacter sp. CFCC 10889]|uniref:cation efflux protein, CzcI-like n=1 Tax=Acinetobacter sp. CFCC 10889 TaxID=1775557 RepID=UPI000DCFD9D3|nr:cation efflux protein, CzcI-like [Acinetobacter sp. CFCC 10889]
MLKRSSWITLLFALLIFQSLWNVAAAFCVHEDIQPSRVNIPHFGHHQMTQACQNELKTPHHHVQVDYDFSFLEDDHQDHLPSFNAMILVDEQDRFIFKSSQSITSLHFFPWYNFYQSPDLTQNNPPPIFAPLQVG